MSRSRVSVKREERRMWSNHKRYLRRRGMHAVPKKQYTMQKPVPFTKPDFLNMTAPEVKSAKQVGFFARLWKWLKGK